MMPWLPGLPWLPDWHACGVEMSPPGFASRRDHVVPPPSVRPYEPLALSAVAACAL